MKKNIFIKVYPELNLGDDLFIKILLDRYPHCNFIMEARKEYKTIFNNYSNLTIFNTKYKITFITRLKNLLARYLYPIFYRNNLRKIIINSYQNYLNKSDIFISIGGSIFMQPKKIPYYYDIEYYKIVNSTLGTKPKFYLGCNFGPYSDINYKKGYNEIFSKATDVCFRETNSKNIFNNLSNIRSNPDIVFSYKTLKLTHKISNSIGFSIVGSQYHIKDKYKQLYIDKYIELIEYFQEKNFIIKLFSFCKKEGDEEIINSIYDKLISKKNIEKVFYLGNIDSFINEYNSVESMFCGRFHSMILSMLFNQNIYPVVYSKKMTNVLEDINYQGEIIKIDEFYNISIENVFKQLFLNKYDIKKQKTDAELQFEILDQYL